LQGRVNWRRFKKIFEFSAVLAGKGKLEKMSRWTSSRCDCKGARKDIHQDIFELISATAAQSKIVF
jgi:hypothetical protein